MGDKVFPLHALWEKGLSKKCTIGEKVILWNVLWEKRYFGRKGLFNTYINGEKGFNGMYYGRNCLLVILSLMGQKVFPPIGYFIAPNLYCMYQSIRTKFQIVKLL